MDGYQFIAAIVALLIIGHGFDCLRVIACARYAASRSDSD